MGQEKGKGDGDVKFLRGEREKERKAETEREERGELWLEDMALLPFNSLCLVLTLLESAAVRAEKG